MEESVFQQAFIPRQLHDVADYERDHEHITEGGRAANGVYYETISGMVAGRQPPDTPEAELTPRGSHSQHDSADGDSSCSPSRVADVTEASRQRSSTDAAGTAADGGFARADREPPDASGSGPEGQRSAERRPSAIADDVHDQLSSSAEDSASDGDPGDPASGAPSREERKAHKKAVKEAARERRKTKIPKHVKKRATKHK